MPYTRKPQRKTYRKRPQGQYKKKQFQRAVTKVIQKKTPTYEVRHAAGGVLVGNPTIINSFAFQDISSISKGTALNQKLTSRIYVCGIHFALALQNNHTAAKCLRLMVVQNKNPADTLDTAGYTDLFETTAFGPKTPDAQIGDMNAPLNRDVVKVICDKKFVVPPSDMRSVTRTFYCPIKRYWTYKTIASESLCSSGKTYVILQATDYTTPTTNTMTYNWLGRLYYKNVDNV